MRHFLIVVLLSSLVAGCSGVNLGPYRIDVQQGNALDQENVARLKPGLNRSQVRFLLGTPLVVDPFRTDRWDYVYVNYKAGKLAEQRRITLFFDGDTLTRIEGDLPAAEPAKTTPGESVAPKPEASIRQQQKMAEPLPSQAAAVPKANTQPDLHAATATPAAAAPVVATTAAKAAVQAAKPDPASTPTSSIVPPLPSPKNAPAYVDPRPPAELSLTPATDVAQLKPDVIPPFPEPSAAAPANDDAILKSLNAWANAWSRRDEDAYLAAYDASFVPQGGGRAEWEKRRRLLLGVAKSIEVKIDSPSVERADDGTAIVTFNQFYRSESYRDAVVKQLRMVERDGRWLIVEEKVLSILRGARP